MSHMWNFQKQTPRKYVNLVKTDTFKGRWQLLFKKNRMFTDYEEMSQIVKRIHAYEDEDLNQTG